MTLGPINISGSAPNKNFTPLANKSRLVAIFYLFINPMTLAMVSGRIVFIVSYSNQPLCEHCHAREGVDQPHHSSQEFHP